MPLTIIPNTIIEPILRLAARHQVRSILHVDVRTGFIGAALRNALDYSQGRLNPDTWEAHITGLVQSQSTVPFGLHYSLVQAEPLDCWLGSYASETDLILAAHVPLQHPRDIASTILSRLYQHTKKLLITLAHNDLSQHHKTDLSNLLTLQLISAQFPRVHFIGLDNLALAVIKNEFLPFPH